ncbi:hypothetical protein LXA43DRAFT_1089823 [Ganoderma leucocontextum]|nr:hypothetical protein LXA43DRAFT_1089823 [Ganoderma leucocontextum]
MSGLKQPKKSRKYLANISKPTGERINFAGSHDHYAYSGGRLVLTDRRVSADIQVLDASSPAAKRPCLGEPEDLPMSAATSIPSRREEGSSSADPSVLPPIQELESPFSPFDTHYTPSTSTAPTNAATAQPQSKPRKRKKNAGERLKDWEALFPKILAGMLRIEAHPLIPGGKCQRSDEWSRRESSYPQYSSPGSCAYANEKSEMFREMSGQCGTLIQSAWDKYHARMAQDDDRQEAYTRTQKDKLLYDQCLRYDLSIRPLVLLAEEDARVDLATQGKASRASKRQAAARTWDDALTAIKM